MIHETKYRKQAMALWEASREEAKVEMRNDFSNSKAKLSRLFKNLVSLFDYNMNRKRNH
ncbi:hypothetical protein [Paenibacillus alginolyticus]|uniref:Uncharacterized protein n=1 Tax=Paenibacillus alginolyticus TaxID=59839 RepID=A0ABT4G7U5_9BACL|nr:hypothetical protein [Paenibacillus alginolyticus]MCY9692242.1 hypothetical protein [Paenibacillus alginolyticus]MEC0145916.1 hypothetical protein [Paenibacillus alginolyticus]